MQKMTSNTSGKVGMPIVELADGQLLSIEPDITNFWLVSMSATKSPKMAKSYIKVTIEWLEHGLLSLLMWKNVFFSLLLLFMITIIIIMLDYAKPHAKWQPQSTYATNDQ